MIFVTKMEGVTDRYQVYDGFGNDYLGFFNTPLDGSSGDTDDPAEVHQQLLAAGQAELGNLGDYSMFIIYTTILDLTDTNVKSRSLDLSLLTIVLIIRLQLMMLTLVGTQESL